MTEVKFKVEGMHCASCVLNVKKAIEKIDGVKLANVDLSTKSAIVKYEGNIPFEEFYNAVRNAGYELFKEEEEKAELEFIRKERIRLLVSWVFTLPLAVKMILSMIFHIEFLPEMLSMYVDIVISGIVIFVIGFPVIKHTFIAIKNLSFNMDSLIGIGTIASFATGVLKISGLKIEDFSVIGAMIMSINHIGNYIKELSTGKASEAIKKLVLLGAKDAHLITEEGIIDVPVENLKVGDILLVKPGEKIPSDGVIIEGETSINESIATGESMPVDKKVGDKVIGATINQYGVIKVRIEKVGKDTFLSQVIKLVSKAQASKVPVQELADKITSYFVPVILLLSILTFTLWFFFPAYGEKILSVLKPFLPWIMEGSDRLSMALFASIATLVIACPCALGLATPTALMVGMGKAATNGILIRKGEAIQRMKDVDTVVFDKTGTITEGKPVVIDYIAIEEKLFFEVALALLSLSEHPLAKAIVDFLSSRQIDSKVNVNGFESIPGKGVKANIDGKMCYAGSLNFIEESGVVITKDTKEKISNFLAEGKTIVAIAVEKNLAGAFAISDRIKPDSNEAIKLLHTLGLKTIMLTGDNKLSAGYIAKNAGIDEYFANLLPEDKIEIVKKLQKQGRVVAMVGDGINDAPALKQSDVGIAIGSGTDIAIESADITLVGSNLIGVYKAFLISTKTFDKIKQNLFWAFFYNVVAIPLAMLGILHPLIAELAMAFSSVNVVANSIRLSKVRL